METGFAERLRALRAAHGLSLAQLADKIGLVKQTVGNFEKGRITPSYAVLVKLADLFCCRVDYLMCRDDQAPVVKPEPPAWVAELMPDLECLDKAGREAVRVLVKGLAKKDG